MNVVVDTNVLVAGLRSRRGASHALLQHIRRTGAPKVHLSAAVILEYEEILLREIPSFSADAQGISDFLDDLIATSVCHARIVPRRPLSSDPDDDCFLELALTADVEVIVTFNKAHFLAAESLGIDLLTPGEILRELRA